MEKPNRTIMCDGCSHCMNIDDVFCFKAPVKCYAGVESLLRDGEVLKGCAFGESTIQRMMRSGKNAKEYYKDFELDLIRSRIYAKEKSEKE